MWVILRILLSLQSFVVETFTGDFCKSKATRGLVQLAVWRNGGSNPAESTAYFTITTQTNVTR
jgi:hypothetical protein